MYIVSRTDERTTVYLILLRLYVCTPQFFFDMDNPEVEADFDDSRDSGDGEEDEQAFDVKLKNQLETEVDIVLVLKMREEEIWKRVLDNVRVNETVVNNAYEGDLIKVLKAGTDEVLQEYELKREQSSIKMSLHDSLGIRSELWGRKWEHCNGMNGGSLIPVDYNKLYFDMHNNM